MTQQKEFTRADALRLIETIRTYGNVGDAAIALGMPRSTLQNRLRLARILCPGVLPIGGTGPTWALSPGKEPPPRPGRFPLIDAPQPVESPLQSPAKPSEPERSPEATPHTEPAPSATDVAWLRLRDSNSRTAAMLRDREAKVVALETQIASMKTCFNAQVPALPWTVRPPALVSKSTLMPILFTSDFQVGEVVKPEEIDGLNEYNKDVFAQRYMLMIDKTIEFADNYVGNAHFPGIFYLRGGDAVSRGLHADLAETDDLTAVPACAMVHRYEREGIRKLRAKFGRVHVISIPGNHGRTTEKPRSKAYVDQSFETMLAWWLANDFDHDPNVTFSVPSSGDAYFNVLGWNFLMSHGDRMGSRGGQGFVGPVATISRGHQRLYANFVASGRPVDKILTGHMHTSCELELGLGNGSLAGYNQYAMSFRARPAAAKQWLMFSHKDHCLAHHFALRLSDEPRRNVNHGTGWGSEDEG